MAASVTLRVLPPVVEAALPRTAFVSVIRTMY